MSSDAQANNHIHSTGGSYGGSYGVENLLHDDPTVFSTAPGARNVTVLHKVHTG